MTRLTKAEKVNITIHHLQPHDNGIVHVLLYMQKGQMFHHIVEILDLCEALKDQTSFIPDYDVILIFFVSIHPSCSNDCFSLGTGNKIVIYYSYARYIGNTDSDMDIQYRQAASFFEEICTETSLSHATPNLLNRRHPVSRRLRATDHWVNQQPRTTAGPPSVTTIGPPPDHCRTTAEPQPDHCRTTAGAPPDDAEDTGTDEDVDADKGDTDADKGDADADDYLVTISFKSNKKRWFGKSKGGGGGFRKGEEERDGFRRETSIDGERSLLKFLQASGVPILKYIQCYVFGHSPKTVGLQNESVMGLHCLCYFQGPLWGMIWSLHWLSFRTESMELMRDYRQSEQILRDCCQTEMELMRDCCQIEMEPTRDCCQIELELMSDCYQAELELMRDRALDTDGDMFCQIFVYIDCSRVLQTSYHWYRQSPWTWIWAWIGWAQS
ncbi:hypothetical protein LXL04_035150 [Taraxacum kok-saghyz]